MFVVGLTWGHVTLSRKLFPLSFHILYIQTHLNRVKFEKNNSRYNSHIKWYEMPKNELIWPVKIIERKIGLHLLRSWSSLTSPSTARIFLNLPLLTPTFVSFAFHLFCKEKLVTGSLRHFFATFFKPSFKQPKWSKPPIITENCYICNAWPIIVNW